MSDSLQHRGLQHTRPSCPSPTPGAYSNSCPSDPWCHPTISSSVVPFSSHLQTFPASGSFPMSRFFTSGSPKYWSFSFSISPSSEYSGLISLIFLVGSPCSPRDSQESSPTPQFKSINSSALSFLYKSSSHIHTWLLEKNIALTRWTFVGKVMSLLFNMLSRLVIAFLPRSKRLLISWLQSPSAVILKPPQNWLYPNTR